MENKDYLMINKSTNTVDNIFVWDGNKETWNVPDEYNVFLKEEVKAKIWSYNDNIKDYEIVIKLGAGEIGYLFDGEFVKTNQEKPIYKETSINVAE